MDGVWPYARVSDEDEIYGLSLDLFITKTLH